MVFRITAKIPNNGKCRGKLFFYAKILNFPGISGRNFFFCFSVNSLTIKVFDDADSEFNGFRHIQVMVFRLTAKRPNLPENSRRNFFIYFF